MKYLITALVNFVTNMTFFLFQHQKYGQKFIFTPGYYLVELYGARGGTGCANGEYLSQGGAGAYVSAYFQITTTKEYYLFVGGAGGNGNKTPNTKANGGWNGGGDGGTDTADDDGSGGGGGATDIREIYAMNPLDPQSINSRLIVAAGGSGSAYTAYGAPGGDECGYRMTNYEDPNAFTKSTNTTQTQGFSLGSGGPGQAAGYTPGGGGGGGYYGGFGGRGAPEFGLEFIINCPGESGSSFINPTLFTNGNMVVGGNTISADGLIKIIRFSSNPYTIKRIWKTSLILGRLLFLLYIGFYIM